MVEGRGRERPWTACDAVDEAVRIEEEREKKSVAVPLRTGDDAEMQAEGGRKRRKGAEGASHRGSQVSFKWKSINGSWSTGATALATNKRRRDRQLAPPVTTSSPSAFLVPQRWKLQ
ncbi:hypothetical protein TgHK011_007618 [Trichoderma gracile]|nr:hypothetical protein TgHK011_007618 [Trichoderma gracile]